jgi:hypothetical protein
MTPRQLDSGDRIESLIGHAAPFLDLVLAAGDRISRMVEPNDNDSSPIRSEGSVALPGETGYDSGAGALLPTDPREPTRPA